MMRTGTAMVQAEAVATIPALSGGARGHRAGNCMGWIMDDDSVPVDVSALLHQLSRAICDAPRPLLRASRLGMLPYGRSAKAKRQQQKQAIPNLHITPLLHP